MRFRVEFESSKCSYAWGDLTWSSAWRLLMLFAQSPGDGAVYLYMEG